MIEIELLLIGMGVVFSALGIITVFVYFFGHFGDRANLPNGWKRKKKKKEAMSFVIDDGMQGAEGTDQGIVAAIAIALAKSREQASSPPLYPHHATYGTAKAWKIAGRMSELNRTAYK